MLEKEEKIITLKNVAKKTEQPMSVNAIVPVTRCSIQPKNLISKFLKWNQNLFLKKRFFLNQT